jgi:hypothetical protein
MRLKTSSEDEIDYADHDQQAKQARGLPAMAGTSAAPDWCAAPARE